MAQIRAGGGRGRRGRSTDTTERALRGQINHTIMRDCPDCGAPVGRRCRKWKIEKGERMYVQYELKRVHAVRRFPPVES